MVGDDGAGLISTAFSVPIFLIFLLLAVQVSTQLRQRTVVADAALIGAHVLARPSGSLPDARQQAQAVIGASYVNSYAYPPDEAPVPAGYVVFTVEAEKPKLLGVFGAGWAGGNVRRSAQVRIEREQ